jgi:hypothetical protein
MQHFTRLSFSNLLSINCTPNKFQMKMDRTQTKSNSVNI